MPRDGQGQYAPPINNWNPAVDGNEADPDGWNQLRNDMVSALSQSVSSDGQTMMTGPLNMGGQGINSLSAPTGNGQALRRDQLIKGPNIASGATINIPNEGSLFEITGTATIENITGAFDGRMVTFLFQDALTIKNGLNIALPFGADITTSAGLMLRLQRIESNKWSVISYPKATETSPGIQRMSRRYVAAIPANDEGPIDMLGVGQMDWDGDKYDPLLGDSAYANIVGTMAAGDIVERGSNSNGSYVRYAGGLQACIGLVTEGYGAGVTVNRTWAAPFISSHQTIAVFQVIPSSEWNHTWSGYSSPSGTTYAWRSDVSSDFNRVDVLGVGFWS